MTEVRGDLAAGFRQVGRGADPREAVRYLSTVGALAAVQAVRQIEHRLLVVQPGHRILDVGCGLGDDVRALAAQVVPGGMAVGIDSSPVMLDEARKRTEGSGLPVVFQPGDANRLAFDDNTFDGCRASRLFHYLDDPRKALAEMVRVTRPGSAVVVAEPETDAFVIDAPDRNLTRKILHFFCDSFRNGWIARQLPGLLRELGLADVSVTPVAAQVPFTVLDHFGLRKVVERAAAAGVVSAGEGAAWWSWLEQADRDGRFLCVTLHLYMAGRKR